MCCLMLAASTWITHYSCESWQSVAKLPLQLLTLCLIVLMLTAVSCRICTTRLTYRAGKHTSPLPGSACSTLETVNVATVCPESRILDADCCCSQRLLWGVDIKEQLSSWAALPCRYSEAQAARSDADADATLTAGPHGLVKHRGRGRDLAALQNQVIAKLDRQVIVTWHAWCDLVEALCLI